MEELPHLKTAWDVDRRVVLDSADKLVIIRFSSYEEPPEHFLSDSLSSSQSDTDRRLPPRQNDENSSSDDEEEEASPALKRQKKEATASASRSLEALYHSETNQIDALLTLLAPKVRKYAIIYLVNTNEVTEFNALYELSHDREPFAVMFFFKGEHIRVDVGTGNNNKINFYAFEGVEDFLPIVDAAYRAGMLGKTLTTTDRTFSNVSIQR